MALSAAELLFDTKEFLDRMPWSGVLTGEWLLDLTTADALSGAGARGRADTRFARDALVRPQRLGLGNQCHWSFRDVFGLRMQFHSESIVDRRSSRPATGR